MSVPGFPSDHDHDLVRSSLEGDERAIRQLGRRLQCVPRIVASLNRRLGSRLDSEIADVSQDVFVLVWQRRSDYEGRARLETWVYRFCYFEILNQIRKSKRRPVAVQEDLAQIQDPEPDDGDPFDSEALEAALHELGPPEADVIRLKHYEGLTFKEIGEKRQSPSSSAKAQYYRGLDWLRARLASRLRDPLDGGD